MFNEKAIHKYLDLKEKLVSMGYADEIDWCENKRNCKSATEFFCECTWVICNSGMKNQIAEKIYKRIIEAIKNDVAIFSVFKHKGKVEAIEHLWKNQFILFEQYLKLESLDEKLTFAKSLPWIGDITKYHLLRNLGEDVCKPDRHLVRIANEYQTTPVELCNEVSNITGNRIGTVDVVFWRAANLGLI